MFEGAHVEGISIADMVARRKAHEASKRARRRGLIYRVTCDVDGSLYIGKTLKTVSIRWRQHVRDATRGSDAAFHRLIREHGADRFTVETIASCLTETNLAQLEADLIEQYRADIEHNNSDGPNYIRAIKEMRHAADRVGLEAVIEALRALGSQ